MRHLFEWLRATLRGPRCPWCGEWCRAANLSRHWHIEHCGDDWNTR